jgi:peptide/nickel transport system permease protein
MKAKTLDTPPEDNRSRFWRRLRSQRQVLVGGGILLTVIIYVLVGSVVFTREMANDTDIRSRWQPPSLEHPFGTDSVGRDVMARTVYGGQVSLSIAAFAVIVMVSVGVTLGLLAGYIGGWVDSLIMRLVEALMSIPLLFLLLVLARVLREPLDRLQGATPAFNSSILVMVLIIGLTGWTTLARIVRANTFSLRERDYVLAARALGATHPHIVLRHILPNTVNVIIVFATLGVSAAILLESYVSFLGLGVQPPDASWGNMLDRATERIDSAPWLWFFPGMFTLMTVLGVNYVGDGLRDALDTRGG